MSIAWPTPAGSRKLVTLWFSPVVASLIPCAHCLKTDFRQTTAADIPLSATAVRPPGTWRYSVEALHPTCRATSEAVMVPDASIAFAALTLMASNAGGRPPIRPRARLAARAVRYVHAEAPPRIARGRRRYGDKPAGRGRGVDVLVQRPQADATCLQGIHGGQKLAHGPRQTV